VALGTAKLVTSGTGAGQFLQASGLLNQVTVVDTRDTDTGWNITGTMGTFRGLNEAFVGREATARVVEVSLAVNGRELQRFMCDGVIVATPAGSTAYSLSVGGPIVSPAVRGLVLVPVGAHTLAQRAFVLGPDDVVEVTFPNAVRASACVTLDGMHPVCAAPLERVTVRLSDAAVPLVRLRDRDFYDVVRRKFLGG
jgi:NAD+ kinase